MFEINDQEIIEILEESGLEFARDIALSILFSLLVDAALIATTAGVSAKLSAASKGKMIPVKVKSDWLNIVGFLPDKSDLGDLGSIYVIFRVFDARGVNLSKYYTRPIIIPFQSYTKDFLPFVKGESRNGSRQDSIGSFYYYNYRIGLPGKRPSLSDKLGQNYLRYVGTSLSNFIRSLAPKEVQKAITNTKKIQMYINDVKNLQQGKTDFLTRKYTRKLVNTRIIRKSKTASKAFRFVKKAESARQIIVKPTRGITRGARVIKRNIKKF